MAAIITLSDVQHWGACRRVSLSSGITLTEAARRWLDEQQIEVEFAPDTYQGTTPNEAQQPYADDTHGEPLLEIQLMQFTPRVLELLGVDVRSDAIREAVRAALQEFASESHSMQGLVTAAPRAQRPPSQRAIITVLGKDRVGIISAITSLLSVRQANVLDINQTLFGDLFSMNMAVDIGQASVTFADLKEALEKAGDELQLKVLVQREAVFDYMHRV